MEILLTMSANERRSTHLISIFLVSLSLSSLLVVLYHDRHHHETIFIMMIVSREKSPGVLPFNLSRSIHGQTYEIIKTDSSSLHPLRESDDVKFCSPSERSVEYHFKSHLT